MRKDSLALLQLLFWSIRAAIHVDCICSLVVERLNGSNYIDLQWYCTSAWWPKRLHFILCLLEFNEDFVQILSMLEVLLTYVSKVLDLFCGAPSGSEPSLYCSNYLLIWVYFHTREFVEIRNSLLHVCQWLDFWMVSHTCIHDGKWIILSYWFRIRKRVWFICHHILVRFIIKSRVQFINIKNLPWLAWTTFGWDKFSWSQARSIHWSSTVFGYHNKTQRERERERERERGGEE